MAKTIKDVYAELKGDLDNSNSYDLDDTLVYWDIKHHHYICGRPCMAFKDVYVVCTVEEFNNYKPVKTVLDAVIEFKGEWTDTHGTCLWYYSGSEAYIFGNSSHSDHTVCTREEFNQCCLSMATNYGTSETYSDYKANYTAINDDMKPAPTFTPEVGAKCLYKLHHRDDIYFDDCYIVGYSEDRKWLVFNDHANNVYQHNIESGVYRFKPVDTRTDKQKAIAEILSYEHTQTFEGLLSDAYDKWIGES